MIEKPAPGTTNSKSAIAIYFVKAEKNYLKLLNI
jgi:hypothetical protein